MPAIGEQVATLSPGGDYVDGIALPAIFQNMHPAPSADPKIHIVRFDNNTSVSFDGTKTLLRIACGGDIEIETAATVKVTGSAAIRLNEED
jgi:phage baseplate assembly protein V